jgi:very-short-patch-repair endonuclease
VRNKPSAHPREAPVADRASRDYGVLTTSELLSCGLSRAGIHRRVRSGLLHPLYRGVYAVGHRALSRAGLWLAAVKASGPGAVLSHQSAAELWELAPRRPGPIHVTVPEERHPHPGRAITIHRSKTLASHDITRRHRISVTTPARTLRDLRRVLPREQWEAGVDRARGRGFAVSDVVEEAPTRSALERKFQRLCRRHRIPAPRVNVQVGEFLVDFLWEGSRLIVEVDGYEFHRGRASFEADRARDTELARRGYRVLRFTHRQVTQEPSRVARAVRELLR